MTISHWLGPNWKKARELDIFETSADELLLCDRPVPIPEKRIVCKKSQHFAKPTCPSCWTCPQPCHGNPRQASGSTLGSLWVVVLEKLYNSTRFIGFHFLWFQIFHSSSHSLVHLSCVNAAIAVLVVHPEHQTQLLLRTPVGSHVDHLESNNLDKINTRGEKIPWQKISVKGGKDAYHDKVAEIDGAPVLAESSKSLRTEVLSFPSWKDLIKTSLVQKMQWKTPGNCFTLVFVTSTHCHTFEYSLEKSSGVICPLGHSFWKAV